MQEILDLDKNLKVAIYGAGEIGLFIKEYIDKNRPDLQITAFFDKDEKADIDGIKVINIEKINTLKEKFDIIIIASASNADIMASILNHYRDLKYVKISSFEDYFVNKSQMDERTKMVQSFLEPKSQRIFELITRGYYNSSNLENLTYNLLEENKKETHIQYLDFINKDEIKTVISGGAYDGGTSILFLDRFQNVEKIYAFEPMYEKFKCKLYDDIIKKSGKIQIVPKGLHEESTRVSFSDGGAGSRIQSSNEEIVINTTTIDEFVKENNIKKVDFIKMDIEGSELPALKGGEKTLKAHRPQLAICIYHSYDELFDIPLYLNSVLENYKYEVYHYSVNSLQETVFYAIPKEVKREV